MLLASAAPNSKASLLAGRRRALLGAAGTASLLLARGAQAGAIAPGWLFRGDSAQGPRRLWITRPQTQESLHLTYWADGRLLPDAYSAINHLYRDVYANRQWPIAPRLLDLNFHMQARLYQTHRPRPLVLLSGYRTPTTNRRVGGVEPNLHGLGLADDFIYEGLSLLENFRLARLYQVGGLGVYPQRGSLHKDLGRYRNWITRGAALRSALGPAP